MAKLINTKKTVPVPLEFIKDLMPKAENPTYVLVYLYGLGQCEGGSAELDNAAIAKALGVLESDVVRAWKYWENLGAIAIDDENNITFSPSITAKAAAKAPDSEMLGDEAMAHAIKSVELILNKPLTRREIAAVYACRDDAGLDASLIPMLAEFCASEGKTSAAYIEKMAEVWVERGISSVSDAENFLKNREKEKTMHGKCKKIFGLDRAFTARELDMISSWVSELSMSEAMIRRAYEITVENTGRLAFAYLNTILKNWHASGVHTLSQIPKNGEKKNDAKKSDAKMSEMQKRELERLLKMGGEVEE